MAFCRLFIWKLQRMCIYLHRVFHGIRFKVNNEDWLS
jgi:hypothetical protein